MASLMGVAICADMSGTGKHQILTRIAPEIGIAMTLKEDENPVYTSRVGLDTYLPR